MCKKMKKKRSVEVDNIEPDIQEPVNKKIKKEKKIEMAEASNGENKTEVKMGKGGETHDLNDSQIKKKRKKDKKKVQTKASSGENKTGVKMEKGDSETQDLGGNPVKRKKGMTNKEPKTLVENNTEIVEREGKPELAKETGEDTDRIVNKKQRKDRKNNKKKPQQNMETDNSNDNKQKKTQNMSTQNKLIEKLKTVQAKRNNERSIPIVEVKKEVEEGQNDAGDLKPMKKKNKGEKRKHEQESGPEKSPKKQNQGDQKQTSVEMNQGKNVNDDEEEDPEKAAMRAKKREKRKLKRLARLKHKQELAEKAGTAKVSAVEYLDTWENKRSEWKFSKLRQCWLLHNMYDETLIDDSRFATLLEYLEGSKGNSREVTVKEAEKILNADDSDNDEKDGGDDNDEKDGGDDEMKTEKQTENDPVKQERARQIIQLLSD